MISKDLDPFPKLNTVFSEQYNISNNTSNNKLKSNPIDINSSSIEYSNISSYHNNDTINKKYETCGCIIISELDILENIIHDKYIQLCKQHYKTNTNKISYYYNKKNNKYIYNMNSLPNNLYNNISHNISTKPSNLSKSYENLQGLLYNSLNKKLDTNLNNLNNQNINYQTLVSFGKYKDKSYEYVYYNDKLYCYNLAFWNIKEFKNKKIHNFITFIKNQLILESL